MSRITHPLQASAPTPRMERAWHALPATAVLETLRGDLDDGLAPAEAARRLAQYGANTIATGGGPGPWRILAAQFASLLVWLLLAAVAVSAFLGEWVDAVAIAAIVVLDAALGFYQEYSSEKALAALATLTAPLARVRRGTRSLVVPAAAVVPGDVLELEAGDVIPADARVLAAAAASCVEASLTGESRPVHKQADPLPEPTALGDRSNMVFMGTSVARGTLRAVVVATGMETEFGRIAILIETTEDESTPLERRLEAVGKVLVWASLAVVALVFGLGLVRHRPAVDMFMTAVSLAVAAVPEGLPAVVTIALAVSVRRMAGRRALIRRLPAVETLGATGVICTDKTGTLTRGEMAVRRVWTDNRGLAVASEVTAEDGAPVNAGMLAALAEVLVGCNDAALVEAEQRWQTIGDPMEGALLVFGKMVGITRERLDAASPRLAVVPFDADRRRMTVVRGPTAHPRALVKGAPEVVLARCTHEATAAGPRPLEGARREAIKAEATAMARGALRVLAAARRDLPSAPGPEPDADALERDLTFVGLVGLQDPPRAGARDAIARCRAAGIRVVMITGDHPETAAAIGRELGLLRPGEEVLAGSDLDALDDGALAARVAHVAIFARADAAHKLRIVRAWRARGHVIAMTGDGVNDAPAIKGADVGIAMGRTGTEVTRQAADMVLADDRFETIVAAVEEGRGAFTNIQKTLQYLLAGNMGELLVMTTAAVAGLPMPLMPIHLLWINLVTDGMPALALATDPLDADAMAVPPRDPATPIMDRRFVWTMLVTGLLTAGVTLAMFLTLLPRGLELARAAAFSTLVCAELLRAFGARHATKPIWKLGLATNPRLALAVGAGLLAQAALHQVGWLERVFGTVPLGWSQGAAVVAAGAVPFALLELRKVVVPWLATASPGLRRNLVGIGFLLAGLAGLMLPVLPGVLLVLAGLLLVDWPGRAGLSRRARRMPGYARLATWLRERAGIDLEAGGPAEEEQRRDP